MLVQLEKWFISLSAVLPNLGEKKRNEFQLKLKYVHVEKKLEVKRQIMVDKWKNQKLWRKRKKNAHPPS